MNGFFDEPSEVLLPPDEVTLQLRLPTALAYAFQQLNRTFRRLAATSEEAAHEFAEHLIEIASQT